MELISGPGRDAVEIVGKESVEGIILDDGERINCQLVVIGKGVQPNVDFISSTPIKVNEGIVADETMRTNLPDIYVAGDVAETCDLSTGRMGVNAIWPCAFEQGRVAGLNMAGKKVKYDGSFRMNSLDFYGLPVISMGITRVDGNGFQQFQRKTENTYRKTCPKGWMYCWSDSGRSGSKGRDFDHPFEEEGECFGLCPLFDGQQDQFCGLITINEGQSREIR